jgi:alpha-beta hydrolase superfamily lysophospholipase
MKKKRILRRVIIWLSWALLVQFILVNISAALYAYKLTHLATVNPAIPARPAPDNIFAKTWGLFTGPTFYKKPLTAVPNFSFSTIILKTKNDISIEAWYGKTDSISKGTVILFHGLTGNKGLVIDEANAFRIFGYNVMMIDIRDHGNSGGNSTTIGYKESEEAKLAYDYIMQRGEKNIFLWGASMGAVVVLKAVSDYQLQPSGIIIEMPFLSLQSYLRAQARFLGFPQKPFGFLTGLWISIEQGFNGLSFKTTRYARNIHCPVLMQYGDKDAFVLRYETDAIYESIAATNKKLVIYNGAWHESFLRYDPITWKREVTAFLK